MKNQTIEQAVEEFNELHTISITLQSGMMIGNTTEKACLDSYERLEKHFTKALQSQRDAGAREERARILRLIVRSRSKQGPYDCRRILGEPV